MAEELTRFDCPLDVMYLIHKGLSAEAAGVQKIIEEFEVGTSLHPFRLAFNSWASVLMFHADIEDRYMTAPMTDFQPARVNEAEHSDIAAGLRNLDDYVRSGDIKGLEGRVKEVLVALHDKQHAELMERLEDVLGILDGEIGRSRVIARTKRHLYGKVVAVRICQDDHLESEEAFVLPEVRDRMSEPQQLELVRHLLIDEESNSPRWILDWVAGHATPGERKLLADLEGRFNATHIQGYQAEDYLDQAADS